jgi:hypothetical protein
MLTIRGHPAIVASAMPLYWSLLLRAEIADGDGMYEVAEWRSTSVMLETSGAMIVLLVVRLSRLLLDLGLGL